MKKLLVTGGSYAEIPLIEEAKKQGWYVITTGNHRDGLGHQHSDRYIPCDYSNMESICQLAKSEGVEGVVSACNDFSYLSTAYTCEKLSLPGHDSLETAKVIHHKHHFRSMVSSLGIPSPKAILCDTFQGAVSASEAIGFPLVVKPIDLFSGTGVTICKNPMELEDAFYKAKKATRQNSVLLEEFISGDQHGSTMLLKNQKVVWSFFDDEQYYLTPYIVAGASSTTSIDSGISSQLCRDVEKVARYLHLVDGLFHVQFIVDQKNYPMMIDPCRRSPGDLYILLAKYATGTDYPSEIIKAETGIPLSDQYISAQRLIARECIFPKQEGVVKKIHIRQDIEKYIIYRMILAKPGDIVQNAATYKAGILIMEFKDPQKMHYVTEHFHELVTIEMESCCRSE